MSFDLNAEQRAFRDVMRGFVDERVAPNAEHYDREQEFPQKSFDACVEMELPSLGVPEEYGGVGADMGGSVGICRPHHISNPQPP